MYAFNELFNKINDFQFYLRCNVISTHNFATHIFNMSKSQMYFWSSSPLCTRQHLCIVLPCNSSKFALKFGLFICIAIKEVRTAVDRNANKNYIIFTYKKTRV